MGDYRRLSEVVSKIEKERAISLEQHSRPSVVADTSFHYARVK